MKPTAIQRLTRQRLSGLSAANLRQFTAFARSRLYQLRGPVMSAADVVQTALERVQLGAVSRTQGRKPRRQDLADHDAFLNYLRGVVASKAEAFTRRHRQLVQLLSDAVRAGCPRIRPDQLTELRDFQQQLFRRLRRCAPTHLQPTIRAWDAVFLHSDRIPTVNGNRKHAHQVRVLARNIIQELQHRPTAKTGIQGT